jgi:hypothetical protein
MMDEIETGLFFVGGAPRSGTTWVQAMLDAHPDVCCKGEGLLQKHLADPLAQLFEGRRAALEAKNRDVFAGAGGYPLPHEDDVLELTRMAILLTLRRQTDGRRYLAVGEKTPENVFFFPRLKAMFPAARFIGVARDPRDVLTSAWHFFRAKQTADRSPEAISAFVDMALPSIGKGLRALSDIQARYGSDALVLRYEDAVLDPRLCVSRMTAFLKVAGSPELVSRIVEQTRFAAFTGGRAAGEAKDGAFYRKGMAGDWRSTLSEAQGQFITSELDWAYGHFGWTR